MEKATIPLMLITVLSITCSGADISVRDNDEMTPLMLAIKAGNVEIITIMLDLGCNIHSEAKHEKSLIVWAIENEYTALLQVYYLCRYFSLYSITTWSSLVDKTI